MIRYAGIFLAFAFSHAAEKPVQVVVMDPLSLPLSCSCVDGVGQRRYDKLGDHLSKVLGRSLNLTFEESLDLGSKAYKSYARFHHWQGCNGFFRFETP